MGTVFTMCIHYNSNCNTYLYIYIYIYIYVSMYVCTARAKLDWEIGEL